MDQVGMSIKLSELRQSFSGGRTRDAAWRKSQFEAIIRLVNENEDQIFQELQHDLGKHPIEVYRDEIGVVKKAATHALSCIDKWMASKNTQLPLLFFPSRAEVVPEPLGIILIFVSWNFPITRNLTEEERKGYKETTWDDKDVCDQMVPEQSSSPADGQESLEEGAQKLGKELTAEEACTTVGYTYLDLENKLWSGYVILGNL